MGRVQRQAVVLAAAAAVAAAGCAGPTGGATGLLNRWNESAATEKFKNSVTNPVQSVAADATGFAAPPATTSAAATDFAQMWQNRPAQLPDPTRGGAMIPGLVGQVFLFASDAKADLKPAEVKGELTVMVTDTTPRPAGTPASQPEVWHFTADVLKRMAVNDERFGRSLAVFLPWPAEWRDVNQLLVQARYDQPGGTTLYAQPATVTLDFSNPAGGPGGTPWSQTANNGPGVPDPRQAIQQATFRVPTTGRGVIPAVGSIPPPTQQVPPPAIPPNVQTQPTGNGDGTRFVIPRR